YMAFVGQTGDPWDVPAKQSVRVMQNIWDTISGHVYEIMASTAVYQKTVQRLSDSWHNVIGSTGIAVVLAFLNSQEDLRDSDEERQEFTMHYLKDLRFLYTNSDHNDRKKWRGLFCSPFILQTFAAHLAATESSMRVPGLHGPGKPTPAAIGGLGLSAASVERALTLVATGTLTVAMVRASKGKTLTLPRNLNLSSGKESTCQTSFSDAAWGNATCGYAISAHSLTNIKFDAIIQEAQEFMKPTRTRNKTTEATDVIDVDEDDERALLIDNSDSDIECESVFTLPQLY
ncbi:hypothetical protein BYT27DRAFT_7318611, partial [Phlegmacium glaucopus]